MQVVITDNFNLDSLVKKSQTLHFVKRSLPSVKGILEGGFTSFVSEKNAEKLSSILEAKVSANSEPLIIDNGMLIIVPIDSDNFWFIVTDR